MLDEITVTVEALAHGGLCVSRVKSGPEELIGKKIFVGGVIPSEQAVVVIRSEKDRFAEADLLKIVEPAPGRVQPPCPYFGRCGGCDLQHIEIAVQRACKLEMIATMLLKQGRLQPQRGLVELGQGLPAYAYRRRMNFHLNAAGELGLFGRRTRDLVDVKQCLLLDEKLRPTYQKLRELRFKLAPFVGGVSLELLDGREFLFFKLRSDEVDLSKSKLPASLEEILGAFPNVIVAAGDRELYRRVDFVEPIEAEYQALLSGRFSQVNAAGNRLLQEAICAKIQGPRVTEFFAGAGNFTIPLARLGRVVTAVEVDPLLVEAGRRYAQSAGVADRVLFESGTAEKFAKEKACGEVLLLDPPRSGAKEVVIHCRPAETKQIVYVSCSLPTLVRDLRLLTQQGYQLDEVGFVDMFPQTGHVETVTVLRSSA